MSRYQKGKTNLDSTEARDSQWQWHQLDHMQVCTLLQTTTPTPYHSVFTGWMPFLLPNHVMKAEQYSTNLILESGRVFLCFFRVFKMFLVGLATGRAVVFYE